MSKYILELILSDLKNNHNLSTVKDYREDEAWIAYNSGNHENAFLLIRNYGFDVVSCIDGKETVHNTYYDPIPAIAHMNELNQ